MDKSTEAKIAAFEERMNVTPADLAFHELQQGKRWTLLEAVCFLACGDLNAVNQVREWCPPFNALPHQNAAKSTSIHLTNLLENKRISDPNVLSFEDSTRAILTALKEGHITAYVDCLPVSLAGIEFRQLTYYADMTGLAPPPRDIGRYWGSVHLNSADVRRVRERLLSPFAATSASLPTIHGAKRGPKPKWDWLNLMGEIVRIAEQDGLDTIGGQADWERWAINWLAKAAKSDGGPSESLVREHIAPIFDAIDRENERRLRAAKEGR